MKKTITLFFALAMATGTVSATVHTVSNNPAGGSQYSTLIAAYNAAANDDTLLLEGTNIAYEKTNSSQPWNKRLVVIGIGYNTTKANFKKSKIKGEPGNANEFFLGAGGNGSKFYGIEFPTTGSSPAITGLNAQAVSNYAFYDCMMVGNVDFNSVPVSNLVFTNCIFNGVVALPYTSHVMSNIMFTSCVFDVYLAANNNTGSLIVDHCLFLRTSESLYSLTGALIQNSIFYNTANYAYSNTLIGCTFLNNVCRLNGTFPPASGGAANVAANNLTNTNPNLVNAPFGNSYDPAHDYELQAGSPAIAAGSDNSNIGPHGSSTNFSETGEALIAPVMRSFNIYNTTVVPNGTLKIQFTSTKPNDN